MKTYLPFGKRIIPALISKPSAIQDLLESARYPNADTTTPRNGLITVPEMLRELLTEPS